MAVVWELADDAERVLRERSAFRQTLRALAVPQVDEDAAELIFGELLANVVRYAQGSVEVRLEEDSGLGILTVRDHGPGLRAIPQYPSSDLLAESGRGLAIVRMLANAVQIAIAPDGGTVVRAVLPIAGDGDAR